MEGYITDLRRQNKARRQARRAARRSVTGGGALFPVFAASPLTEMQVPDINVVLFDRPTNMELLPINTEPATFGAAFSQARAAGLPTFWWHGQEFSTLTREEAAALNGGDETLKGGLQVVMPVLTPNGEVAVAAPLATVESPAVVAASVSQEDVVPFEVTGVPLSSAGYSAYVPVPDLTVSRVNTLPHATLNYYRSKDNVPTDWYVNILPKWIGRSSELNGPKAHIPNEVGDVKSYFFDAMNESADARERVARANLVNEIPIGSTFRQETIDDFGPSIKRIVTALVRQINGVTYPKTTVFRKSGKFPIFRNGGVIN